MTVILIFLIAGIECQGASKASCCVEVRELEANQVSKSPYQQGRSSRAAKQNEQSMVVDGNQVHSRVQIFTQVHSDEAGPVSSQEVKSVGEGLGLD